MVPWPPRGPMAVAPDSRYYVHASTQAARAQQEYLRGEAEPSALPQTQGRTSAFDLRTDWWIVLAILGLVAGMTLLMAFVR